MKRKPATLPGMGFAMETLMDILKATNTCNTEHTTR